MTPTESTNSTNYSTPPILVLSVGEPKTGKTVSACTFPKPILFLDFDKGFESVRNARDVKGNLIVPEHSQCTVVEFIKEGYFDLDFKTELKGSVAPMHTNAARPILEKFNEVMKSVATDGVYNGVQYKTLVIDSLTAMFGIWKDMILNMNKVSHLRIQDYDTLDALLFRQLVPSLKAINKKIPYVILINHVAMDKDEVSGRVSEFPVGPSNRMGKALGKEFDEIWIQKVDGADRVWKTTKDGLLNAGSRLHLPETIKPATFNTLESIFKVRRA